MLIKGNFGVPYYRYEKKPEGFVATVCIPKGGGYTGAPAVGKEQVSVYTILVSLKVLDYTSIEFSLTEPVYLRMMNTFFI